MHLNSKPTTLGTRRDFILAAGAASVWAGLGALAADGVGTQGHELSDASCYDPSFMEHDLVLMRRSMWAEPGAEPKHLTRVNGYSRITIHHQGASVFTETDEDEVGAEIRNVRTSHCASGYGDIGYHFVVDFAGRVWEGRPLVFQGAHVSGENECNIGVMALGNFQEQRPSPGQLRSILSVVALLRVRYDVQARNVFGHRDLGHTLCPGRLLYGAVVELRGGSAGGVEPLTAPEGGAR